MSKLEKLLQRIRNNPKTVRFEEIEKLLLRHGFIESQSGGGSSHYIFKRDETFITIPRHGKFVNEVYILKAIAAL
ncbi:MAG: type II toxin-antitoxin system HicA family toxin [Selenomonadaceae bacterium]|nr:type II toxin-antitoxin system HicA family toxin [Selenomonadaceae bacterium]MBR4382071.1 type II toxin-antitoxin system HicA family toxin [Selenomonadaceae bacterium]